MDAADERVAAGNPFRPEAGGLVGSARADIFRKDSQPNAPGLCLFEDRIDDFGKKRPAIPAAGRKNGYSLHQRDAFRRRPITHDGKADRLGAIPGNEIGMTAIGKGSAVLCFLPAANKLKARIRQDAQDKELLLEGVCSIVEGMNPKLIRVKLEAFLQHGGKKKKAEPEASPAAAPAEAKG